MTNARPVISRPAILAIVFALCVTWVVLFTAHPASAHSELVSSVPETGSTSADVSDVTLTFSEEVVPDYTTVTLSDAAGNPVALEAPTMDATNTVVTARIVAAPLGDGSYALAYYIVSIDGHPIEGTVTFDVAGSPVPVPSPGGPTPTETAEAQPLVTETPVPVDAEARLLTTSNGGAEFTWVWVGTGVAAVVVLGAVSAVLLIALRRRRESESGD
jgi:methionine-rich copper-binding protein CopC